MNEYDLFRKLLEDDMVDINAILIKNYKKLDIDEKDIIILSCLARQDSKGSRSFIPKQIVEKVGLSQSDFYDSLDSLSNKNYIEIKTTTNPVSGKECEVFSLISLYKRIVDLYLVDERSEAEEGEVSMQEELSNFFDKHYKKQMSPLDADFIRMWCDDQKFTVEEIENEMLDCLKMGKTSLKSVDQALIKKQMAKEQSPEYENINNVLDGLREKWKK